MEMEIVERPAIVVDNGANTCKVGYAGESDPTVEVTSVTGKPRPNIKFPAIQDIYIGEEATQRRGILNLHRLARFDPNHGEKGFGGGIIYDWEVMVELLDYAVAKLGTNPFDHRFLMSISSSTPDADLIKMQETMFETLNAPAIHIEEDSVLALFASQRTTGVIVNVGHEVTHVIPIQDGIPIDSARRRIRLGGKSLTDSIVKMLQEKGYGFASSLEAETVAEDIKKKLCFVSQDFENESNQSSESSSTVKSYTLTDGNVLSVDNERFRCPEMLFKPRMFFSHSEVPGLGVSSLLHRAIDACSRSLWDDLYQNIVLTGGSSLFPGFGDRLKNDLIKIAPAVEQANVSIDAPEDRQYSPWIGGSIVASLPSFHNKWITKQDYEERGHLGNK